MISNKENNGKFFQITAIDAKRPLSMSSLYANEISPAQLITDRGGLK